MSTSAKPNILLIITDHQAFYGHDRPGQFEYKWPRFEQFAAAGTRFDRAYSVSPICSPARASMMTGQYPSKHGMVWNCERMDNGNQSDFKPGQALYSHYLSKAGYRNGYVGKWHCGHTRLPVDYGIEGWSLTDYGKPYMCDEYRAYAASRGYGDARARIEHHFTGKWEGTEVVLHHPSPWQFMNGSGVLQGPPEAHEEQFVAHQAVEKIRELAGSGQPWSLVASFWGPHQPYYPSEPYASMIDPKSIPEYPSFRDDLAGRPLRHFYHRDYHHWDVRRWRGNDTWPLWQELLAKCYGQALQTDAAVGSVLDSLEQLGVADNTIVMWVADHGDAIASHGGMWDKASTMTEEVMRVPFAVRWPKGIPCPRRVDHFVTNMDVTATLLEAAGIPVPAEMDSRSVLPLCRAADPGWPDQLVCEHNGHGEDILQRMIVHGSYKYVAALYDGDELYDLAQDPYEMHNLVDSPAHREVKAELRNRIIAHIRTKDDVRAERLAYSLRLGF
jgi:arylsulfatase A-like enzyme